MADFSFVLWFKRLEISVKKGGRNGRFSTKTD
nr:MAG TPA: hypothetical protein [Caudoviricetes sp.]